MGNTPNAANSPDFEILVGVATSEGSSIGNSVELIKAQLNLIMENLSKNPGFNVLVGIDEKTKGKFEESLKQIVDNIKLEVDVDSKTSSSPTVASPTQTTTPPVNGGGVSAPKSRLSSPASFLNNKSLVIENAWQKAKLDNVNLQKISGSYVQLNNTIKEHSQLARELSIKEKATLNARISKYIELIKKQKELQKTESQAESNQKYLNSKSSSVNKLKGKIEEYGFDDKYKDKLLQNVSEVENAITDYSTNATALTDKEKGVLESKIKLLDKNIEKVYKLNELEKKSTLATTPDQKYLNSKAFDLEKRKSLIEEYTLSDERKEELLKNIAEVESVVTAYSEKTTQLTDKEKAAIEAKIKTLTENINKVRKLEESEKKAALAPSYNDKYLNSKSLTFERQKTKIEEYGFDDKYKDKLLQNIAEIDSVFSDYSNRKTNLTNKEKAALEAKLAILDEEVKKTKKASDAERSYGEYNEVYVRKSQNALRELVNIKSNLKNSDYNEEFKNIAELFKNTEKSGLKNDFEEANGALSSFKKKLNEAGVLGNNLFTNIDTKVRSFTSYLVGSGMVMMFIKQLTDALSVIKKIDDSLTTVDMTMRLTRSEMKLLGSQSIQIAKEFSTSIENVLNVLDIFTNRASGLTNLVEKMRATMMLSTASGLSSTAASDLIQGAMFQFDYDETEENFMRIVDVIESVSASVGVDFQESVRQISEGIKTSGSIAAEAGYSLEEYSSTIAMLVERTRKDGSEIANSLKMIFSRLGQNREGESTAEEISRVESAYKSLGIEIRSSATEFRDIPDVFEDLSKQWKNLTDVQKAYIAEVSAGNRNRSIFLAMMNNYEKQVELTTTALESQGFAEEANAIRVESLSAKLQKLDTTFNGLIQSMVDIGPVKGFISAITDLIGFADGWLVKAPLLISSMVIIKSLFNQFGASKMGGHLKDTIDSIKGIGDSIKDFKSQAGGLGSVFKLFFTRQKDITKKFGEMDEAALKSAKSLQSAGRMVGITIAVTAISLVFEAIQRHNEAVEEARQKTQTAIQTTNDAISAIGDYKEQISSLREELDKGNLSQADASAKRQELMKVQDEIINKYKLEAGAIDLVNGNLQDNIDILDSRAKKVAKDWLLTEQDSIKNAQAFFSRNDLMSFNRIDAEDFWGSYFNHDNGQVEALAKRLKTEELGIEFGQNPALNSDFTDINVGVKGTIEERIEALTKLQEQLTGLNADEISIYFRSQKTYEQLKADISKEIKGMQSSKYEEHKNTLETYAKYFVLADDTLNSLDSKLNSARSRLIDATARKNVDDVKAAKSEIESIISEIEFNPSVSQNNYVKEYFDNIIAEAKSSLESAEFLPTTSNIVNDIFTEFNKEVSLLNRLSASQRYDKGLSTEVVDELIAKGEKYVDLVELQNGKWILSQSAVKNLSDELYKNYQTKLLGAGATAEEIAQLSQYVEAIYDTSEAVSELNELSEISEKIANGYQFSAFEIENLIKAYPSLEIAITKVGNKYKIEQSALRDLSDARYDEIIAIKKESLALVQFYQIEKDLRSGFGNAYTERQTKNIKQWVEENLITNFDEYVRFLNSTQGTSFESGSQFISKARPELVEYLDGLFAVVQQIKDVENAKKLADTNGSPFKEDAKAIDELNRNLEKYNAQRDEYDKAASAVNKVIDKRIKQLEEEKALLQEANDEKERSIELSKLEEALERAKNNRTVEIYREGYGFVYEADATEVKKAQEELDKFWTDDQTAAIDKQIQALNDYKDQWSDIPNSFEESQNDLLAKQILGADYESKILSGRLDTLATFSESYIDILSSIHDVQNSIAVKDGKIPSRLSGAQISNSAKAAIDEAMKSFDISSLNKYVSGVTIPVSINAKSSKVVGQPSNNTTKSVTFTGDIVVQGVKDPDSFAKSLKENISNIIKQEFYK